MEDVVIVGAGAAGSFAAAVLGEILPGKKITLLEKTRQPLAKVKISGGGRCNVTHNCFEVKSLIENYPRGRDFLQSAFYKFRPKDMIAWLEERNVPVKAEADGRCFPDTNRSQTIIDCFLRGIEANGVSLLKEKEVVVVKPVTGGFEVVLKDGESILTRKVLFATGGLTRSYSIFEALGHEAVKPIPSLFGLELEEEWIKNLSGSVVKNAKIALKEFGITSSGPMLLTHFGISGPAVLKLSAFGALKLASVNYQTKVTINWTGLHSVTAIKEAFYAEKNAVENKKVILTPLFSLSKNLWHALLTVIAPSALGKNRKDLSRSEIDLLSEGLFQMPLTVVGKTTNKEEFVTAGGVSLDEIYPKTMESRKTPGVYFAGEVLNIDGVTGGFNFQSAWTTAWIAAHAISESLEN